MKCYKFIISGKVQGVYYRKSIAEKASSMGFNGYVKNLSNGNVEAKAMLDDSNFNKFVEILKKGSMFSAVTDIKHSQCNDDFLNGFEIRY